MAPMEPMKPLHSLEPMEALQPISRGDAWWPQELGEPSATGMQNGMRYAVFPDRQRLLVETDGTLATYDSGDHQVGGIVQTDDGTRRLSFTSQHGLMALDTLTALD